MLRERSARASSRSPPIAGRIALGAAGASGHTPGARLMITAGNTARSLRRRALLAGVGLALLLPARSAASAAAASLEITVSPAKVRRVSKYTITVARALPDSASCAGRPTSGSSSSTPRRRASRPRRPSTRSRASDLSLDYRGKEHGSPFTRRDRWTAGNITGVRHVCAYLYPKVVSAGSSGAPDRDRRRAYRDV